MRFSIRKVNSSLPLSRPAKLRWATLSICRIWWQRLIMLRSGHKFSMRLGGLIAMVSTWKICTVSIGKESKRNMLCWFLMQRPVSIWTTSLERWSVSWLVDMPMSIRVIANVQSRSQWDCWVLRWVGIRVDSIGLTRSFPVRLTAKNCVLRWPNWGWISKRAIILRQLMVSQRLQSIISTNCWWVKPMFWPSWRSIPSRPKEVVRWWLNRPMTSIRYTITTGCRRTWNVSRRPLRGGLAISIFRIWFRTVWMNLPVISILS